jgi:hypothetical protein
VTRLGARLVDEFYKCLAWRDREPVQNTARAIEDLKNPLAQGAAKFPLLRWTRQKLDTAEARPTLIATDI